MNDVQTLYQGGIPPLIGADPILGGDADAGTISPPKVDTDALLGDPSLDWLTPEFWRLIDRFGIRRALPQSANSPAGRAYADRLAYSRPTATLSAIAESLGLPADYARGYLRAINSQLEAIGITLRERRLKADGKLGETDSYTGVFVEPSEKNRLYTRVSTTKRALAKAQLGGDGGAESNLGVAEAEAAHDDAVAALDAMKRVSQYLPVERHAFTIFINPAVAPSFLTKKEN